jgi:hypothetical protein
MSSVLPCVVPSAEAVPPDRLGDPMLDVHLEFLAVRCRPNSTYLSLEHPDLQRLRDVAHRRFQAVAGRPTRARPGPAHAGHDRPPVGHPAGLLPADR